MSDPNISNPNANPDETTIYTVTKTNKATGCSNTASVTVTVDDAIPETPTICVTQPSLCGPSTGSITIKSPVGTDYEYSIDNGSHWQSSPEFINLSAGSVTGIKVKRISTGCVSGAADCSDSDCTSGATLKSATIEEVIKSGPVEEVIKSGPVEEAVKSATIEKVAGSEFSVRAFPNPFSNEVKFVVTVPEAGNGSLELFNLTGQKVKTIYKGHMNAGINSYEISLPVKQSAALIYMFRAGEKQLTGKLLQISQ